MNKYLILILVAAVLMGLGGFLINRFGAAKLKEGTSTERAENNAEVVQELKKYEKQKQKNYGDDDTKRAKRYCRWVYGSSYNNCVSNYKFVD